MWADLARTGALVCPVCGKALAPSPDGRSLLCAGPRTHCFDLSRSGYVNLSGGRGDGDGREAVRSRHSFLCAGYYGSLLDRIRTLMQNNPVPDGIVLDAGSGEGYYSRELARSFPEKPFLGLDLSRDGVDLAQKSARAANLTNADYAVANLNQMPLSDACAGWILNIFAPCLETAFARVLVPGGRLLVVAAGPDHLMGLKELLYEKTYPNAEREDLPRTLPLLDMQSLHEEILVRGQNVADLFAMTPYYWRTPAAGRERLAGIDTLRTVIDFEIRLYGRN